MGKCAHPPEYDCRRKEENAKLPPPRGPQVVLNAEFVAVTLRPFLVKGRRQALWDALAAIAAPLRRMGVRLLVVHPGCALEDGVTSHYFEELVGRADTDTVLSSISRVEALAPAKAQIRFLRRLLGPPRLKQMANEVAQQQFRDPLTTRYSLQAYVTSPGKDNYTWVRVNDFPDMIYHQYVREIDVAMSRWLHDHCALFMLIEPRLSPDDLPPSARRVVTGDVYDCREKRNRYHLHHCYRPQLSPREYARLMNGIQEGESTAPHARTGPRLPAITHDYLDCIADGRAHGDHGSVMDLVGPGDDTLDGWEGDVAVTARRECRNDTSPVPAAATAPAATPGPVVKGVIDLSEEMWPAPELTRMPSLEGSTASSMSFVDVGAEVADVVSLAGSDCLAQGRSYLEALGTVVDSRLPAPRANCGLPAAGKARGAHETTGEKNENASGWMEVYDAAKGRGAVRYRCKKSHRGRARGESW